jgi:hypothetical protein
MPLENPPIGVVPAEVHDNTLWDLFLAEKSDNSGGGTPRKLGG